VGNIEVVGIGVKVKVKVVVVVTLFCWMKVNKLSKPLYYLGVKFLIKLDN